MIDAGAEFPPFDETQQPSCGPDGRQFAPETFVRWVAPAMWEDTVGAVHHDIPAFHRWLGMPETPESFRETAEMMGAMLSALMKEDPDNAPAVVIVRP